MYRIDMHVHTAESSRCGTVPAVTVVEDYIRLGYSAIVITDHFKEGFFNRFPDLSPKDKIDRFLVGYRLAKEAGDRLGLRVFLGAEVQFPDSKNEFLLYGITEEFLYEHPDLYCLGAKELHSLVRRHGILCIQAHPLRDRTCSPADFDDIDGMEIFNGHYGHENYNEEVLALLTGHPSMIATSSSDCHTTQGIGKAGITVNTLPATASDLCRILREGNYSLIRTPRQHATLLALARPLGKGADVDGALARLKTVLTKERPDGVLLSGIFEEDADRHDDKLAMKRLYKTVTECGAALFAVPAERDLLDGDAFERIFGHLPSQATVISCRVLCIRKRDDFASLATLDKNEQSALLIAPSLFPLREKERRACHHARVMVAVNENMPPKEMHSDISPEGMVEMGTPSVLKFEGGCLRVSRIDN